MDSSSSASSPGTWTYRVFVSFHGPDVRKTFLSHLRKQFSYNGITMFDDQKIERSQIIAPALTQAIRESRISIVVLSKNYASSSWCLDELEEIFKCKEKIGQIVMTIFYEVDPSDVRKQTGEFGNIFKKTCRSKTKEQRQKWSKALEDVAIIAGEHFLNWDNESEMIEKIARDVSNKLNATISWDFEDMVGIEAHLQKMQSLLHLGYEDGAMIVGICGPTGIGKTTIARALHSRLSSNFQLNCFMTNIRGSNNSGLEEYGLKLQLQEKLLSKILNQDGIRIYHLSALPSRLCDQKVLIFLDDVDDLLQLEALANKTSWFGPGSRIIITTEDQELLEQHDINDIYHVGFPTEEEACKIFYKYAFRRSLAPCGFEKLAERVIHLCSNLPLGLHVMGSTLRGKKEDDWKGILHRLENSLDRKIDGVLRVGYDQLHKDDQLLFLLIAFFFDNVKDDHVKAMLADSNLDVRLGLKNLAYKSLIQITMEGNIVMHKLLQQVGREAVQRQDPSKRQILIHSDDILTFLENESDRRSVIGISLDITTISNGVHINVKDFKNIQSLQFIRVHNARLDTNVRIQVPQDMNLPHRLRLLHWDAYPGKRLPRTLRPEFLVELNLRETNLEKLWEGIQPLTNLKKMDLSYSTDLKELPDLSKAEKLEILKVNHCSSLEELPPSIAKLRKLTDLEMSVCEKLQVIPTLFDLESLEFVGMFHCGKLKNIPDISTNITEISISESMLEELPDSIRFCGVKNFMIFGNLFSEDRHIEKLPDWIKDLHQLKYLEIDGCPKLASLPELPASLVKLLVVNCESLETFVKPNFPRGLYFSNCFKLDQTARTVITNESTEAYLPGGTIPEKFDQQATGNSLTIRSDFNLFKICVVLSPNQPLDECSFLCGIRINGCPNEKKLSYYMPTKIEKEHLYMSCVFLLDEIEGWREQDKEILFEFRTTSPQLKITQCGVLDLRSPIPRIRDESSSEELSEDGNIERLLRVGYDSLCKEDQLLFLLIAVFFNSTDDAHLQDMLAENNLNVHLQDGLETLKNKSLIQRSIQGNIMMDKLQQQVGREAIKRQDPGRREILIDTNDILIFLNSNSEHTSVIGISLDVSTIPNFAYINAIAFKNIRNLQFIRIHNAGLDTNVIMHVPGDMIFSHRLRLLHWDNYPGKSPPRTYRPEFLVELSLRENNMEKLWDGIQPLPNLKKMDLYGSWDLKELPDLSKAEKLEILIVNNCWSLEELPPSILNLQKLERLDMAFCVKLQVVPSLLNLASLHRVWMWGCWQLKNIPDISTNMTDISIVETMLEDVPDSSRLCGVKYLTICGSNDFGGHIEKLPDWIKDLHQLEVLYIDGCPKLASLPELPASLLGLMVENCESLETFVKPNFPRDLYFSNCFKLDQTARTVITNESAEAYLPGGTIPEEFDQQATGNSLTIRSDFNQFKICVVLSPNQPLDECSFLCDIRINGCPNEKKISYDIEFEIQKEHLYMSYVEVSDEDEGWREQDNEILFEFRTTSPALKITQCGVLDEHYKHRSSKNLDILSYMIQISRRWICLCL